MILYLHGFASCGDSNKTRLLKEHFEDILSPDIPVDPDEAVSFLQKLVVENEVDLLIGSSLGGYYASYLAEKFQIKTVLLNPSTQPFITLAPYVGTNEFFCSGESFEWTREHIHKLMPYAISKNSIKAPVLVLLQKGDEVLDYTKAAEFYGDYEVVVQEGGNHRFENLDEYIGVISEFIG
ncbi:MAG: hypothetical protein IBX43_09355 [Campylobacterales bacterium]|nr:hypothetical protein [Campylobacterales bacterium]